MRLGVVMMGMGAHAAAHAGVLRALFERGIVPHSVCGLQGGAWSAALYAMGFGEQEMQEAVLYLAKIGPRLLPPASSVRALLGGRAQALFDGRRIERLLLMQTGHQVLSLCMRPAIFPCRMIRTGQRVVFATRSFEPEGGAILAMQATVSFAVRAALAAPPILSPMEFMGSALLGESDAAFAGRQLLSMGADHVLIVRPKLSSRKKPDVLDLAGAALGQDDGAWRQMRMGLLEMEMPDTAGAMDFSRMALCNEAGYHAAKVKLDGVLEQMGMAVCRVLPFSRSVTARLR